MSTSPEREQQSPSEPWTVRCVRDLYEYNTVQIEWGPDLRSTLDRAQSAADEDCDGWEFSKRSGETRCDAAAAGAHEEPEDGTTVGIPQGYRVGGDRGGPWADAIGCLTAGELVEALRGRMQGALIEACMREAPTPWDPHPHGAWYCIEGMKQGLADDEVVLTTGLKGQQGRRWTVAECARRLEGLDSHAKVRICRGRGGQDALVTGVHEPNAGVVEMLTANEVRRD